MRPPSAQATICPELGDDRARVLFPAVRSRPVQRIGEEVDETVAGTYAPRVIGRFGPRRTLVGSLAGQGALITALLGLGTGSWSVWLATAAVSLASMCHLGAIISYGITVTSGVPDEEQGLATGLVTSTQQVGITVGIPLLGVLATTSAAVLVATGPRCAQGRSRRSRSARGRPATTRSYESSTSSRTSRSGSSPSTVTVFQWRLFMW